MNCEICKSKKATLFYADESGIRHALCGSCGESINRIGNIHDQKKQDQAPKYIPEPSLCSFLECANDISTRVKGDTRPRAACQCCGSTLELIIKSGKLGCPDCYECFGDSLSVKYANAHDMQKVRMPSSRRFDIDRRLLLTNLKAELRGAIENENFELAASLRDKIRKHEAQTKIHN